MRVISEWDETDLNDLIRNQVMESLTLDYKDSRSLQKTDRCKSDISKDVSAFANSAGGMIIYGIPEVNHVPQPIDGGVDHSVFTKEWLESVIRSNIVPIIEDIVIKPIPLSAAPGNVAFVINIPAATYKAPHQTKDYRYYKRYNFESVPLEDYQIRDIFRRSIEHGRKFGTAWNVLVEFQRIRLAASQRLRVPNGDTLPRDRLEISVLASLRSGGEAMIGLERELRMETFKLIGRIDDYNSIIETTDAGNGERIRVTEHLRDSLGRIVGICDKGCDALIELLDNAP